MKNELSDLSQDELKTYALNFKPVTEDELDNGQFRLLGLNAVREKLIASGAPDEGCYAVYMDAYAGLYLIIDRGIETTHGYTPCLNLDPICDMNDKWYRDTVRPKVPRTEALTLTSKNRKAVKALLTVHKFLFPSESRLWY